jgi:hypothetical protein
MLPGGVIRELEVDVSVDEVVEELSKARLSSKVSHPVGQGDAARMLPGWLMRDSEMDRSEEEAVEASSILVSRTGFDL